MSQPPTLNDDGTITATVIAPAEAGSDGPLLRLHLPVTIAIAMISGRYFLICNGAPTLAERIESSPFTLRKPLFAATYRTTTQSDGMPVGEWGFYLPLSTDTAYSWLHEVKTNHPVNLLGPFGSGFQIPSLAQRLLMLLDSERSLILLALIEQALDAGKKVAVLVKGEALRAITLSKLAIAVEVHCAADEPDWDEQLPGLLRWADQLYTTLSMSQLPTLAHLIQQNRSRFDTNFAQVLVEADLLCGVGACLACVVPLANQGLTRACIHGPVMDLAKLV